MFFYDLKIWDIISMIGIFTGIILVLLFLIKSKGGGQNLPLIIFVVILLFDLGIGFITSSDLILHFPNLIYTMEPFATAYGLLIYLYARNQVHLKFTFYKSDLLLLLPILLSFVSYIPFYMLSPQEKLMELNEFGGLKYEITENIWEWIFEIVVNTAFFVAALKTLRAYNERIKRQYSSIQHIDLHFTQTMVMFGICIYSVEIIFVYLTLFGFPYYNILASTFEFLQISLLLLIAFDAVKSKNSMDDALKNWVPLPEPSVFIERKDIKYAKSNLDQKASDRIKAELLNFMETEQPYLEPQLRIKDLSEKTGISSHHISQVVNESFQQNFHEFINGYRVKYAIRILKEPSYKNYTLSAIGFEVGFNSKSAFYTAFKKETQTTPAQYIKNNK